MTVQTEVMDLGEIITEMYREARAHVIDRQEGKEKRKLGGYHVMEVEGKEYT